MTGQNNHPVQITARAIGEQEVQTVNARELHEYLGVGKDYSTWITDRIEQYKFNENEDFVFFTDSGEKSQRGRPSKEYYLSLDMAKELAMVERNAKGREVRKFDMPDMLSPMRESKASAQFSADGLSSIFSAYMHESRDGRAFAIEEFSELVEQRRAEAAAKGEPYRPIVVEIFEAAR